MPTDEDEDEAIPEPIATGLTSAQANRVLEDTARFAGAEERLSFQDQLAHLRQRLDRVELDIRKMREAFELLVKGTCP